MNVMHFWEFIEELEAVGNPANIVVTLENGLWIRGAIKVEDENNRGEVARLYGGYILSDSGLTFTPPPADMVVCIRHMVTVQADTPARRSG